jgi:NIMA-interacting peptidyl-prolyl cis-trans isomerase 1
MVSENSRTSRRPSVLVRVNYLSVTIIESARPVHECRIAALTAGFHACRNGDSVASMTSALRRRPVFLGAIVVWGISACGGPPAGGASSPSASGGSAAEHCLAAADAKRERSPSEPDRISVKHVLVKYDGAKGAPATVTRTREQACLRAEEALAKLKDGTSFADVVAQYSDESGAATREGSIGTIERADVAPAFADAAFQLHMREVSAVVETAFGFHLILRVE